ncbi:MAG: hypothetical protein V1870_04575 [Candidatus Aenigmatarchaeota archaeon]
MCLLAGISIPDKIIDAMKKTKYDIVFICDTLSTFDSRVNTG